MNLFEISDTDLLEEFYRRELLNRVVSRLGDQQDGIEHSKLIQIDKSNAINVKLIRFLKKKNDHPGQKYQVIIEYDNEHHITVSWSTVAERDNFFNKLTKFVQWNS